MAVTTTPQQPHAQPPDAGPGAISAALAQISSRLRLARWVRHASRGALIGTAPALIALVLAHWDRLPDRLPLEAAVSVPLLLGLIAGTVTAFLHPISAMDAARLAEARLGLKERLSSALEFEKSPGATDPEAATLRRLQMADAASHAQSLRSRDAVPIPLPWELKALAGALVLIALALIVPRLPVFVPPGVKIEEQIVQKTGTKLENTAKLVQKQADAKHLPGAKRTAAQIQQLAKRMEAGRMDKKKALVEMSKLTQQMRHEQQQAAQAGAGTGGKSLSEAGRQLAQALAGGQSSAGANGKQAGAGQKTGGAGQKGGPKAGQNAGPGGKPGASQSGFTIPAGGKPGTGQQTQGSGQTPPASIPEVQKAAQAMGQNDSQALSQQLRSAADKIGSGQMTPAQQQQTAADLQKLADALKNTPMPETQKHAQAAADALKRGDKQTAASELRRAAASAEKEAQQQADQQAQSDAAQGVEDAQSQMAGANSPGDVSDSPGQPGAGQGKGAGQGHGNGQGDGLGDGSGLKSAGNKHGSGKGNGGSGGGGKGGGKPGDTGNGSSPLKHLGKATPNPQGAKLYFGRPLNAGPSKTGPAKKVGANPNAVPGQTPSRVPYYNYVGPAQKSAESAMDKEDIPPAYRSDVRRYFNSLNPPAASGGTH